MKRMLNRMDTCTRMYQCITYRKITPKISCIYQGMVKNFGECRSVEVECSATKCVPDREVRLIFMHANTLLSGIRINGDGGYKTNTELCMVLS